MLKSDDIFTYLPDSLSNQISSLASLLNGCVWLSKGCNKSLTHKIKLLLTKKVWRNSSETGKWATLLFSKCFHEIISSTLIAQLLRPRRLFSKLPVGNGLSCHSRGVNVTEQSGAQRGVRIDQFPWQWSCRRRKNWERRAWWWWAGGGGRDEK